MARVKVGITLTEETLKRLDEICKEFGLSKSQAISFAINTCKLKKNTKGESNASK